MKIINKWWKTFIILLIKWVSLDITKRSFKIFFMKVWREICAKFSRNILNISWTRNILTLKNALQLSKIFLQKELFLLSNKFS